MMAAYVCYMDTPYFDEQKYELIYAITEDFATEAFTRKHGEPPEIIFQSLAAEKAYTPINKADKPAVFVNNMKALRAAGAVFEDDRYCEDCGELWPFEKHGFCGACDSCPDCGCKCSEEEKNEYL